MGGNKCLNHWPHYKGKQSKFFIGDIKLMWWESRGSKDEFWGEFSLKRGEYYPTSNVWVFITMFAPALWVTGSIWEIRLSGAFQILPFDSFTGLKCPFNSRERRKSYATVSNTCPQPPSNLTLTEFVLSTVSSDVGRERRGGEDGQGPQHKSTQTNQLSPGN